VAEYKHLRARDGSPTTPGGLIRKLIELTAAARRHHPGASLWVYHGAGRFFAGIRYPRATIDAWTRRHGILDDTGRPLRLVLSHLRKAHKALWYLKTEGHVARFAVGHTPEVAARHYADVPALLPLHEGDRRRSVPVRPGRGAVPAGVSLRSSQHRPARVPAPLAPASLRQAFNRARRFFEFDRATRSPAIVSSRGRT
jgi:hypothetical protein